MTPLRLLVLLALLTPPAIARASCFDGQLPATPWARAAALSAVRLVLLRANGQPFGLASGVVVAHSGSGADPRNRILSAGHVLRDLAGVPGSALAVMDSDGEFLGYGQATAAAAPGPAFGLHDPGAPSGLRFGDLAVLRLIGSPPDAVMRFASIPGVPLSRRQPAGLLRGDVANPAGVDPGVSGAGVLRPDGTLLGIMAAKLDDPAVSRVNILAGDASGGGRVLLRLPAHAVGYATPISDPTVLAALGRAGERVRETDAPIRSRVLVAGYPRGACVVYHAFMAPT